MPKKWSVSGTPGTIRFRAALTWLLCSLPCLAIFIALGLPLFFRTIGVEYDLSGNLAVFILGSIGLSLYSVFCIAGWVGIVRVAPRVDGSWRSFAPLFVAWVVVMGQLFALMNEGALLALTPLGIATSAYIAAGVLLPRLVLRSIRPGSLWTESTS